MDKVVDLIKSLPLYVVIPLLVILVVTFCYILINAASQGKKIKIWLWEIGPGAPKELKEKTPPPVVPSILSATRDETHNASVQGEPIKGTIYTVNKKIPVGKSYEFVCTDDGEKRIRIFIEEIAKKPINPGVFLNGPLMDIAVVRIVDYSGESFSLKTGSKVAPRDSNVFEIPKSALGAYETSVYAFYIAGRNIKYLEVSVEHIHRRPAEVEIRMVYIT